MTMKEYKDATQAKIEAGLLNALGSNHPSMAMVDSEQITGATMLNFNIFYDEARVRVAQALNTLHTNNPDQNRRLNTLKGGQGNDET